MLTSKRNECCIFYCLLSVFLLFSFIKKRDSSFSSIYINHFCICWTIFILCFAVTLSPYFLSCRLSHVANELKHAFSSVCLQHCLLHFYKSPSPALRNPTLTKLPFLISWKKKLRAFQLQLFHQREHHYLWQSQAATLPNHCWTCFLCSFVLLDIFSLAYPLYHHFLS